MKRLSALVFIAVFWLVLVAIYGQAQTAENHLSNPGFEGDFVEQAGEAPQNIASGWTAWHIPRSDSSPAYANHAPFYDEETVRTRGDEAGKAQVYFNQYATHQGGIYQQVSDLTVGADYRFSIYAWVWSSIGQDWHISEQPGNVSVRVGIDPTGGTDSASGDIIWSTTAVFLYNAYYQYSVIAEAESETLTVFVESTVGEPVANNYIFLEDAVLEEARNNVVLIDSTPTREVNDKLQVAWEATASATVTATGAVTQDPLPAETQPTNTATPDILNDDSDADAAIQIADAAHGVAGLGGAADLLPHALIHIVAPDDTLSGIAWQYGSSSGAIMEANGLENTVILVGQELAVPVNLPEATATLLPAERPSATATPLPPTVTPRPTATPQTHVVRAGDTILGIAVAYGTTVEALVQLNGVQEPEHLALGLALLIPQPEPTPQPTATPLFPPSPVAGLSNAAYITYTVQVSDTLDEIATAFNTTVAAIVSLNSLANPSLIFPGQFIHIPVPLGQGTPTWSQGEEDAPPTPTAIPSSPPSSYIVQEGDTLFLIARRFGVSVVELAATNNIIDYSAVYAGLALSIPG